MEELVPMLDQVKRISPSRCIGRCPAHPDKKPSLAITEGDRGLLVRCWTGCNLSSICRALGIRTRDLFYDALDADPQKRREAAHLREAKLTRQAEDALKMGRLIDSCKAAQRFLDSRQPTDISQWSAEWLDHELSLVCDAYRILEDDPYATN